MKATQLQRLGGTDALTESEVSRPEPGGDELLVRVHAAGVNPIDWLVCRDALPGFLDQPLPWIPGWDLSGEVASVGSGVTDFEPGDAVYGMVRMPGAGGTFAEYATVESDEVAPKPASLSHVEAAALPMVGQTAYHALFEAANLGAGDRVLVHAAAGGVGHVAVQLATDAGAHVVGTASGRNETYLRSIGVDEFVNYRDERFEESVEPVDIVLDGVGGAVLQRSADVVRPGGLVVTLPDQPSEGLVEEFRRDHDVELRSFSVTDDVDPATLLDLSDRIEAGVVEPTISDVYPLSEAETALDVSGDGHVRGKLVLVVAGPTWDKHRDDA